MNNKVRIALELTPELKDYLIRKNRELSPYHKRGGYAEYVRLLIKEDMEKVPPDKPKNNVPF